jgi:undecaprenyl-diphosphatase
VRNGDQDVCTILGQAAKTKELYELHKIHLSIHGWALLAVGLVVASISAFFAIWA